jgi:hypothetical protein
MAAAGLVFTLGMGSSGWLVKGAQGSRTTPRPVLK